MKDTVTDVVVFIPVVAAVACKGAGIDDAYCKVLLPLTAYQPLLPLLTSINVSPLPRIKEVTDELFTPIVSVPAFATVTAAVAMLIKFIVVPAGYAEAEGNVTV